MPAPLLIALLPLHPAAHSAKLDKSTEASMMAGRTYFLEAARDLCQDDRLSFVRDNNGGIVIQDGRLPLELSLIPKLPECVVRAAAATFPAGDLPRLVCPGGLVAEGASFSVDPHCMVFAQEWQRPHMGLYRDGLLSGLRSNLRDDGLVVRAVHCGPQGRCMVKADRDIPLDVDVTSKVAPDLKCTVKTSGLADWTELHCTGIVGAGQAGFAALTDSTDLINLGQQTAPTKTETGATGCDRAAAALDAMLAAATTGATSGAKAAFSEGVSSSAGGEEGRSEYFEVAFSVKGCAAKFDYYLSLSMTREDGQLGANFSNCGEFLPQNPEMSALALSCDAFTTAFDRAYSDAVAFPGERLVDPLAE